MDFELWKWHALGKLSIHLKKLFNFMRFLNIWIAQLVWIKAVSAQNQNHGDVFLLSIAPNIFKHQLLCWIRSTIAVNALFCIWKFFTFEGNWETIWTVKIRNWSMHMAICSLQMLRNTFLRQVIFHILSYKIWLSRKSFFFNWQH